jgi:type IV secretory pathway VirB10-like protein
MEEHERKGRELVGRDVDQPEAGSDQHGVRSVRADHPAQYAGTATAPTQKYRMKADAPSTGMFIEGVRKYPGEEIELSEAQARAASQFIEQTDGKPIPSEQQVLPGDVGRSNLVGMARHERIDALKQEKERLQKRIEAVDHQIANEEQALEQRRTEDADRDQQLKADTTNRPNDRSESRAGGDRERPGQVMPAPGKRVDGETR